MTEEHTSHHQVDPIIVVGAGPTGLGAALELARCGLRSILLERNERTSWHPKTRNFNTRSMEIARGWGREVYEELRQLDLPPNWKTPIRFMESIVGKQTGHLDSRGFAGAGPELSPVSSVLSSQDMIEPVLRKAIERTGMADVRFNHEVVEIVSGDEDGASAVEIKVKNRATGEIYSLKAPALVAADGASSFFREKLKVEMDGPKKIAHFINCYFRADLEKHIGERTGILHFFSNKDARGVFQPLDAKGRWLTQLEVPEAEWSIDYFDKDRCVERIRLGAGIPDLPVEVLSIGKWQMNAVVGRHLISGRIILVGDAAHMFPPTGGLGANTGLQGMHNAIWKLALYLKGKAGRELLSTYETERRPFARWVADQSYHNRQQVWKLGAISRGETTVDEVGRAEVFQMTSRYGNHIGLELGSVYESTAVVPDGSTPPAVNDPFTDYIPSGVPGCRAPHVWIERDGERLSTLDLVSPEFSILAGAQGEAWRAIATAIGTEVGLDIQCHLVGTDVEDVEQTFGDRFGVSTTGAVLVRPDGFIAWRVAEMKPGAEEHLRSALLHILHPKAQAAMDRLAS
ncbi:FAD-binding protein [Tardiphaga alba]|uniref:FAD-binding protein n=1 Tax=Tardiphaga alba TaxID=340268 RepID=A0ABX8ACL2_9BRAD|nr:FAD-dependent monooxygenase [Tardiphaga alba]QUS41002.1 FAD-binding protein [Tardiphaga alba]